MKHCLQVRNPFNFVSTQYFENESMEFDKFFALVFIYIRCLICDQNVSIFANFKKSFCPWPMSEIHSPQYLMNELVENDIFCI